MKTSLVRLWGPEIFQVVCALLKFFSLEFVKNLQVGVVKLKGLITTISTTATKNRHNHTHSQTEQDLWYHLQQPTVLSYTYSYA